MPQRELHRYGTTERSPTGGRGRHAEQFDHYAELTAEAAHRVIAERAKRNGADTAGRYRFKSRPRRPRRP